MEPADHPTFVGESLSPVFENSSAKIRDYVLFNQEWPWYPGVEQCRYASSGIFDGINKYCRYYGLGGGFDTQGNQNGEPEMLFGRDAAFDDHDHEMYDLQEDPHELVNLAVDRSRREEVRSKFSELRSIEHEMYGNGF